MAKQVLCVPIRGGCGVVPCHRRLGLGSDPSVGERCARGIILKQTLERAPLIRYAVLHHTSSLPHQDLLSCVMPVGLDVPNTILRVDLLRALHAHYGHLVGEERQETGADMEFITKCHLAEAIYADMNGAEKTELPEVHDAFNRKLIKAAGSRLADATWPSGRGKESAEEGTNI